MTTPEHLFTFGTVQDKALFETAKTHAFSYMDRVHRPDPGPVFPSPQAIENLNRFDEPFPRARAQAADILDLLHLLGSPATVAQTGGRYFGFVNGSAFPVALAARWLADVWDQNAAMYVTSPVASKLEAVCEAWLKEIFGLPRSTVAGFVSGTSTATFAGLAAARNRILANLGWDVAEKGLFNAPRPRVILGAQAHSTVFKALSLLGFGRQDLELVDCDSQGRMQPQKMPNTDRSCLIIAQAGNVNTGAFDPLDKICGRANGAWIHVDGAFGLWAAGSLAHAHLVRGMEQADSWSVDAHKTLNTPYDCGIILCRWPEALVSSLQNSGAYIVLSDQRDPMQYTPEMSRRARGIDLWATLKYLGKVGLDQLVQQLCQRASQMGEGLKEAGFVLLNQVVFNQVLVSCPDPEKNLALVSALQKEGCCWCGSTLWQGRPAIRISVCAFTTTPGDVAATVQAFARARKEIEDH